MSNSCPEETTYMLIMENEELAYSTPVRGLLTERYAFGRM